MDNRPDLIQKQNKLQRSFMQVSTKIVNASITFFYEHRFFNTDCTVTIAQYMFKLERLHMSFFFLCIKKVLP